VVNVRDDAEIAYESWIHSGSLPAGAVFLLRTQHAARDRAV
jgi:hypothetical protein